MEGVDAVEAGEMLPGRGGNKKGTGCVQIQGL